jgi:hypothetical protein
MSQHGKVCWTGRDLARFAAVTIGLNKATGYASVLVSARVRG